jgi:hypothetical protein
MNLDSRFLAFGFLGQVSHRALPFNWSSGRIWKTCLKRTGTLKNVFLYGEFDPRDTRWSPDGDAGNEPLPGIGLSYQIVFNSAPNATSKWTGPVGGTTYLQQLPNPFRAGNGGTVQGLGHKNNAANTLQQYTSTIQTDGLPLLRKNTPHVVRFALPRPPKTQTRPLFTLRFDRNQFQIADGQALFMTLSDEWTQTLEDAYNAKLAQSTISEADQADIDTKRAQLYSDFYELSLGNGADTWYNPSNPVTLIFNPEGRGKMDITRLGAKTVTVEKKSIVESRPTSSSNTGIWWHDCALNVRCTGGMFFWQVGELGHAPTGDILLSPWASTYYPEGAFADMILAGLLDAPAGTSIAITNEVVSSVEGAEKRQLRIHLATTNPKISPRFYHLYAYLQAGARDGSTANVLDTDDLRDPETSDSPIVDVQPQYDADGRTQCTVTIRDCEGETLGDPLLSGLDQGAVEAMENRVATAQVNAGPSWVPLITRGIVTAASVNDQAQATAGLPRAELARAEATATITLRDKWGWLYDTKLKADPVLDGLTVGAGLCRVLGSAGETVNDLQHITTTGSNAGRRLPTAALGDPGPCVRFNDNTTYGDALAILWQRWGMGRFLDLGADGLWYFNYASAAIVANFTSDSDAHDSESYPGRYAILSPLDRPRGVSEGATEFYNIIRVTGRAYDGSPIVKEWRLNKSINPVEMPSTGALSKMFIGRPRELEVEDSGLRTAHDVAWVRRSLMYAHAGHLALSGGTLVSYFAAPRYLHFESYFHPVLRLKSMITVDGLLCRVEAITGGSLMRDRMSILARELEPKES